MRADPCAHTSQEANYGYRQELDMIPLMMQQDYSAKGWLGLILGTRLWYATNCAVIPLMSFFVSLLRLRCISSLIEMHFR